MANNDEMSLIEKASAEAFIVIYNEMMKTNFKIVEMADAPDVRCKDDNNNIFNFEITLTADADIDIAAALGRSDHKSIDATRERIKNGKCVPNCLQGNVLKNIISKIQAKSLKDYGGNCGLLVRDSSAVMWDWELVVDKKLEDALSQYSKPYEKGIWLLSFDKKKIYCLHPGKART